MLLKYVWKAATARNTATAAPAYNPRPELQGTCRKPASQQGEKLRQQRHPVAMEGYTNQDERHSLEVFFKIFL